MNTYGDDSLATGHENSSSHLQQDRCKRAEERLTEFERGLFEMPSRYLVLVLTLRYKPGRRHEITLDDLRRDRDKLLNNRRHNELLRGIQEYAWRIEEGWHGGGLHMHCVLFYDDKPHPSDKPDADVQFAREIGEYWNKVVTGGRGEYWNSNGHPEQNAYGPYGDVTGPIDSSCIGKRAGLREYLLAYIAKDGQPVHADGGARYRVFGTSQGSSGGC